MKKIVISAVNFNEGGPLSVLKDCLESFRKIYKEQKIELTVFVHRRELVKEYLDDFCIIEYPLIKSSWLRRIYFEYFQCIRISKKMGPSLWIALHDMTPNVRCPQIVYCHNPAPFYPLKLSDLFYDKTFFLFCLFYKFLYRINIRKNLFVIVQQQWIREEFEKNYKVKAVVAYPFNELRSTPATAAASLKKRNSFTFFFPAFPRVAKNFETLLRAALELSKTTRGFELWLTISGRENKYAEKLYHEFGQYEFIRFLGSQSRADVFKLYIETDCMVFPSKLETWGLPISEFKEFDRPMLLADLKYAHEALGDYEQVKFFNAGDALELAGFMKSSIDHALIYDGNKAIRPPEPNFRNWDQLVCYITTYPGT